ncbi:MAG TPA: ABC transporter permease [Sphingomicrobium sp.]|nr:ABC transporter permease [Sphingomicrobium sp.]
MRKLLHGAFVIARRDFSATVLSKTFLFFLLGPLFPFLFGGAFGGIVGGAVGAVDQPLVAVIATEPDFKPLAEARSRLADGLGEGHIVRLVRIAPRGDFGAQQQSLLTNGDPPVQAVLANAGGRPHLTGAIRPDGTVAQQMRLLLANASTGAELPPLAVTATAATSGSLAKNRERTALVGQVILFFLSLLLSTMLLSQLIEEKSNKIIEVIAAAVPIDALFIGKLFAMLAASIVGLIVWAAAGAGAIASLAQGGLGGLPVPALGWPAFLGLGILYFAMNYLLLGAVFLAIGAQATTAREVQTLSMPATFAQVVIFGFAATAIGAPDSGVGLAAAIFPLSSPLAMLARAAQDAAVWPHIAALVWQMLWVALILRLGAGLFRKTVLKSGPRQKRWRLRRA